jgi:putative peptide zinc metalloprotease protein
MRRILFLLSLLFAFAFAGVTPATAWAQEDEIPEIDNPAIAINTEDGSSIFEFAFDIRRVAGDVVDETNAAVAYNECEQCRAVAVAIQIVLVVGHPSVVTPENVAVAVNYQCTLCESLAMAYQFVIGVPADFHFSGKARSEIVHIRNEIRKLRKEELPLDELRRRIDALADRLRQVIREDIQRYEERKRRRGDDDDDDEDRRPPPPAPPPPASTTTTPTETDMETFPTYTDETTTTETAETETETATTATTTTP